MLQTKLKFMIKVSIKDGGTPTITKIGMLLNQLRHEEGQIVDTEISNLLEKWVSEEIEISIKERFLCTNFLAAVELLIWAGEEPPTEVYFYPFTSESMLKTFMTTYRVESYRRRKFLRYKKLTFPKIFRRGAWISHTLSGMRFFLPGFTEDPVVKIDELDLKEGDETPGCHADFVHSLKTAGGKIKSYKHRFAFQRRGINFRRRVRKQKFDEY